MAHSVRSAGSRRSMSKSLSARPKPPHILIVDDEVLVRDFVDHVLRAAGYLTVRALDGQEALEIAERFGPFDLLLTDEMMPRMEGHELAQRLSQQDPRLKVLYLTGYSERLFAAKGGKLRPNEALLHKPSTGDGLLNAIALLLRSNGTTTGPAAGSS